MTCLLTFEIISFSILWQTSTCIRTLDLCIGNHVGSVDSRFICCLDSGLRSARTLACHTDSVICDIGINLLCWVVCYRFFALNYAADAACTVLRVDQVIDIN